MKDNKFVPQPATFKKSARTYTTVDESSFQEVTTNSKNEQVLILRKNGGAEAENVIGLNLFEPDDNGMVDCEGNYTFITIPRGMRRIKRVTNGTPTYWNGSRDNTPELYTPSDTDDHNPKTFPFIARVHKIRKHGPQDPKFVPRKSISFNDLPVVVKSVVGCSHGGTCAQSASATDSAKNYLAVEWEWNKYYNSAEEVAQYEQIGFPPGQPVQMIATLVTDKSDNYNSIVWVPMLNDSAAENSHKMMQENRDHLRLDEWDKIKEPIKGAKILVDRQLGLIECRATH